MREVTANVGVEISGVAGRDLVSRAAADECQAALDAHGVVIYRDAHIDDRDLVAFSRLLGEVVVPRGGGLPDHPEVSVVSLDPSTSAIAEYLKSTFFWHLDGAQDEVPQKATLLAAHGIADEGGDTEFADTYAAYDALSESAKAEIDDVQVVHSLAASQALTYPDPTPAQRAAWARVPSRVHPLVWRRPDGRRSLLVGATAGQVVGMDESEGRALLDRILEWATRPEFVLRHRWRHGDLVVWDNTGLLHRALPYDATSRRLLHRTTLVGEVSVSGATT